MTERPLDFIGLGRAAVDLYGEQVGGRLEDMASFAKYIGGSPTNTAIGGSRLGLRTAVIARVGDEHMGRFVRETLAAEGVDVSHVKTDPARLTALVILGIRDRGHLPSHLLSGKLRGHGGRARGLRASVHRLLKSPAHQRHPFLDGIHLPDQPHGHGLRQGRRH